MKHFVFVFLITVYYPTGQRLPERRNADGFNLIQLAMSRDLKQWKRVGDRQPFLEPSPLTRLVGNYDRLQLAAYNGIIQHAAEVRFYYGGLKRRVPQHDHWPDGSRRDPSTLSKSERADWLEDTHSAMCLAVLRQDEFVSLRAGQEGGELLTKPIIAYGNRLILNVDVGDGGHLKAEILDINNRPLEPFSLQDCIALEADGVRQVVFWRSTADIGRLAGKHVRLRITLKNADLYSFQFAAE